MVFRQSLTVSAEDPNSGLNPIGLTLKNEEEIGEGHFGVAYLATADFGGRERRFVVKKYKDIRGEGSGVQHAQRAMTILCLVVKEFQK